MAISHMSVIHHLRKLILGLIVAALGLSTRRNLPFVRRLDPGS